jgi:putative SOS response-associated peptidase YedK
MCGRYTLKTSPDQWGQLLLPLLDSSAVSETWRPRYNIAPTQKVVAVTAKETQAEPIADYYRWGLLPSWAAELAIGNSMINARRETLQEKRSFKGPLEKRRCLVLADGYYEWQKRADGSKQPQWITAADSSVMCFAGLWETNKRATGQPVESCTIITTAANAAMQPIHDRMPVVLEGKSAQLWLDLQCGVEEAYSLLGPVANDFFTTRKVSTHVNSPRHEDEQCIEPM